MGFRESKNRPVATNFQFLKNSCPFGTASCWGVPAPNLSLIHILNTADFILQCGTTNRNDVGKYAALMAVIIDQGIEKGDMNAVIKSVSYTHLDVYKRQV